MLHASVRVPPPPVSSGRRSTSQEHVDYPSHTFYRTIRSLDTPATHQSNVEVWADKGVAMGMPSWTMDGSDPAAWYASAAAAREFALAGGGPTLIHVETMRGCGHAHHHDDLYLGAPSGNPPGYVDRDLLEYWAAKDPIPTHEEHLLHLGVDAEDLEALASEANDEADSAWAATEAMPWPEPDSVRIGVTALTDADAHEITSTD